ncbi:hypothetical protein ACP6C7_04040 [Mycolicibacterium septicum]|uniref:Antitoxin n=1 Tax=Mycolicibacterium septicum TaxID=98668 RepID=A0ABW9LPN3_9MYCO
MTEDEYIKYVQPNIGRDLTPEEVAERERRQSPEHAAWVAAHREEIDAAKAKIRIEDL